MTAVAADLPSPHRVKPRHDVVVFALGLVLGQALSAATTPLFTRALGPADFGALDVVTVLITLLVTLFLSGMDQAVVAHFFADDDPAARRQLVGSGLGFVLIAGIAGCATVFVFRRPLTDLLFRGNQSDRILVVALVGVPPTIALAYATEVLRLDGRAAAYALSGVLRSVVGAALGIWLAVAADLGVEGVLLGLAGGSAVGLLYDLVVARKLLRPRLSRPALRSMLSFGLPLVPAGLAFWSLMVVDRLVLVHAVPLREVGYYALANKIALLMMWGVYGFRAGWTTSMLETHARDPEEATRARAAALSIVVGGASVVCAALGSLSLELVQVGGGTDFHPAARLVPVLLVSFLAFSSTVVFQSAMVIRRRSGPVAVHTIGAAVLNIVCCVALVPRWGTYGAAVANVVGFVYLAVGLYVSAQRIAPVPYRFRLPAVAAALSLPYLLLGQISLGPLFVSVFAKLVLVSLLPLAFCKLGIFPVPRRFRSTFAWRGPA